MKRTGPLPLPNFPFLYRFILDDDMTYTHEWLVTKWRQFGGPRS